MEITKEQIAIIKKAKSVAEFSEIAKKAGYNVSEDELLEIYNTYHNTKKSMSDAELMNTVGGSQWHAGSLYSDGVALDASGEKKYLIVGLTNTCQFGDSCCRKCIHREVKGLTSYCTARWWVGGKDGHESNPDRRK